MKDRQLTRITMSILQLMVASSAFAQNPAVTINVDANANRHAINPNIYGVAYATTAELNDLNAPLNRMGGNNTSRYNWLQNADNRGQDWYFESIGDNSSVAGERGDTFIADAKAANAQAMMTIPMLDWVAKLGSNRAKLASFSIAKYGAQQDSDWQWFPDAGNGVLTNGQFVPNNNANDANVASSSAFQQGWVQHLVSRWGTNANGGLRYYLLDNEPSIWQSTHRDVHPTGETMDEMRNRIVDFATMIKNNDASALVVAPEEWGWSGYFYSGYDQQYGAAHNWSSFPDRNAHGGADYLPWLLDQLRASELNTGRRLIDIFTVHFYPQGGEFSNDVSSAMQLRRNRSTRALWDPNYVDETWINDKVQLIPRLHSWTATHYPGTKIGITEYNWGAESHINGATTQADIFGIFGREDVDLAARWTTPDPNTPTYKAMKLYRNYDGNKSTFGDTSVLTNVPNPDALSAFGAVRSSDGALTVMVVNKTATGNTPITINIANQSHANIAQAWQLTASNAINRLGDVNLSGNALSTTVPPQSVTLFVIAAGTGSPTPTPTPTPTATPTPTPVSINAPSNLHASATNSTRIKLNWMDNSPNESGFQIERCSGVGCTDFAPIATVVANAVSYTNGGLQRRTSYTYRVRAFNSSTTSSYSNTATAKTPRR